MLAAMSTSSGRRAHVGLVGAGQLARMTLQAAIPLGLRVRVLAERPDDGAALVAPDVVLGSPNDPAALVAFARDCDVVTFDHELVPPTCLDALVGAGACLRPSAETMRLAQDKRAQRQVFADLGLPVPPFRVLSGASDTARAQGRPRRLRRARGLDRR
jgi:5-(carboxyamino)imidazole ribonucleotide synthase